MRKKHFPFFLALATVLFLGACKKEEPKTEPTQTAHASKFTKSIFFSDSLTNIQSTLQTKDSGFILAGSMENRDLLMKVDKWGNKVWMNVMDETNSPYGLEYVFSDQNKIATYRTASYGNDPGQVPVLKFFEETTGKIIDQIPVAGAKRGFDVQQEQDGYVVVGPNGFVIQKINRQGTVLWTHQLTTSEGISVSKLKDGNYISIGGPRTSEDGLFLIKFNKNGQVIWSKPGRGHKVQALSDNGFVALMGHSGYNIPVKLTRFDASGNEMWSYEPGMLWDRISLQPHRNVWLLDYGKDKLVLGLRTIQDINFYVINDKGVAVKNIRIPLAMSLTPSDGTSVLRTLDNGLLLTYDTKSWANNRLEATIHLQKITYADIFGN